MAENLPSIDTLRLLLRYEPETGRLFWRERPVSMFADGGHSAAHCAAKWNAKFAGKEALAALNKRGYLVGSIFNGDVTAHRAIWAIVHGEWPQRQVDHINGNRTDNRISNLRLVTNAENSRNAARSRNNSSGVTGVHWFKKSGKWQASIMVNKRSLHIGLFTDFEDAVAARKAAEAKHGFHKNHGRVAA